jgi:hypothetical protein
LGWDANGWVTDQPTFNYKLPCDLDKTPAVAVVVHGLNHMDLLEENDEGEAGSRYFCESLFWASQPKHLSES